MKLLLITGLSGAGKSVALKALEDAGYDAIDNLPLPFIVPVARSQEEGRKLAITADIRSRDFTAQHFTEVIKELRADPRVQCELVFLDCDAEILQRRFTETRRRHPLATDRPVMDGIRQEQQLLSGVRALADRVIDTSEFNPHELRAVMLAETSEQRELAVTVTSFSYKRGLPREADLVFDVRFLSNPHYEPSLQPHTGLRREVGEYIEQDEGFTSFYEHLQALLLPLLPRYLAEGKSYLTLAIGCTGGKHRSVYIAEKLSATLKEHGFAVTTRHRDMPL